jgi:hypothetical protein
VSRRPRLERLQPGENVVVRRRRYRTRTGRYAMEFEVQRLFEGGAVRTPPETMWVNQRDYEQLWRDGRLRTTTEDDSEDGDDREARSGPRAAPLNEPRTVLARGR